MIAFVSFQDREDLVQPGDLIMKIRGHRQGINGMCLLPLHGSVFTASDDRSCREWNWSTGAMSRSFDHVTVREGKLAAGKYAKDVFKGVPAHQQPVMLLDQTFHSFLTNLSLNIVDDDVDCPSHLF